MAVNSNRRINIFINGKEVENTLGGVKAAYDELNRSVKQCEIGGEKYWEQTNKIKQLKTVLDEHTASIKTVKTGWDKMGDSIKETALGFIGATAIMGAFSKLTHVFEGGIDKALEYEAEIEKLKFSLKGNNEATRQMIDFANEMSKTSLFPRDKILEAETMALSLGHTEDQAKKMTIAAMALTRIDPKMTLQAAISFLNGTFGGTTKQIERLVPEIKGLTAVQYASGEAIDIIVDKYGKFAHEGLESTKGKIEQFSKSWDILKINMGEFAMGALDSIVTGFAKLTGSMNSMLEKPVSQEMEEERLKANALADTLKDVNLNEAGRKEIFEKLKTLAPEIVEGLDAENLSYVQLNKNLEEYNNKYLQNIVLQTKEEELKNLTNKQKETLTKYVAAEITAKETLTKVNNILAASYKGKDKDKADIAKITALKAQYDSQKIDLETYYHDVYMIQAKNKHIINALDSGSIMMDDSVWQEQMLAMKNGKVAFTSINDELLKKVKEVTDYKKASNIIEVSDEDKKKALKIKNAAEVLKLEKNTMEVLLKMKEDETDVLEKALITQAINNKKVETDRIKQKEKDLETQNKLVLDAMDEGLAKELAKEDERDRKEIETNKGKHAILAQERITHEKNIESIKKGFADKRQKYLDETKGNSNEIAKEKQKYAEELALFNKFVLDKDNLTTEENEALAVINKIHQERMDKLDVDSYKSRLKIFEEQNSSELNDLKLKHTNELNAIITLEQAKLILSKTWSDKQLIKIKTLSQAKNAISKEQHNEEIVLETKQITDLQAIIDSAKTTGTMNGVTLANTVLSATKLNVLTKAADDLKARLATMKVVIHELEDADDKAEKDRKAAEFHSSKKVDILGFASTDWDSLFTNLKQGKIGVNEIVMAVDVLKNTWTSYAEFLTASENKKLRVFEANNTKEKDSLKKKLDNHLITQTAYDTKIAALDADLQKQKDAVAYKQALRNARLAEVSAIQQAAVGSLAAWALTPPNPVESLIMEGLIAGQLVASIAAIESNMPEKPVGYEAGGYTTGDKIYRAGEAGPEWIASNDLLKDRNTAPVIKWLENYQRGGKSIPMPIQANFSGIQNAINNRNSASLSSGNNNSIQNDPEVKGLLVKLIVSHNEGRDEMKLLNKYLSNPENRKARLVRDELTKFDNEIATLQSLAKIA